LARLAPLDMKPIEVDGGGENQRQSLWIRTAYIHEWGYLQGSSGSGVPAAPCTFAPLHGA